MCYIFIALCSFQSAFTFLISCDLGKNLARLYIILTLYQSGEGSSKKGKQQNKSLYDPGTRKRRITFFPPIPSMLTVKLHFLVG